MNRRAIGRSFTPLNGCEGKACHFMEGLMIIIIIMGNVLWTFSNGQKHPLSGKARMVENERGYWGGGKGHCYWTAAGDPLHPKSFRSIENGSL
jgi:hypothetical protein